MTKNEVLVLHRRLDLDNNGNALLPNTVSECQQTITGTLDPWSEVIQLLQNGCNCPVMPPSSERCFIYRDDVDIGSPTIADDEFAQCH